jgi:hypothetical protein
VSFVLFAAVPLAAQETPTDVLAPAVAAMDALEYGSAVDILEALLARTDLAARDSLRALELLGACQVYLGNHDAALAALADLSRRDPGWTLPAAYPPRVRVVFDEAVLSNGAPVAALVETAAAPPDAAPGTVAVRLVAGVAAVESVRAVVASPDGSMVRQRLEPRGDVFIGVLPLASLPPGSTVSYWIEAVAPSGFVVGRRGGEDAPLSLVVSPSVIPPGTDVGIGDVQPPLLPPTDGDVAATPWYESWWFWTVVGAVVAGGTATATVLVIESSGPRDAGGGNWEVW